jgi:hypothetical protein
LPELGARAERAILRPPMSQFRFHVCLAGALAVATGCNGEAESRAEAKDLLQQLRTLSGDGTLTQRQSALDALKQLPLREPSHVQARDLCHAAHLQLLQAETSQVSARKALEDVTKAGGGSLSPERGAAIAAELQRSNDALAEAKRAFPKCEQVTIALTQEGR